MGFLALHHLEMHLIALEGDLGRRWSFFKKINLSLAHFLPHRGWMIIGKHITRMFPASFPTPHLSGLSETPAQLLVTEPRKDGEVIYGNLSLFAPDFALHSQGSTGLFTAWLQEWGSCSRLKRLLSLTKSQQANLLMLFLPSS